MHTYSYACHTAHLDPVTGQGMLVMPHPADDVLDPFDPGMTLPSADLVAVGRHPAVRCG